MSRSSHPAEKLSTPLRGLDASCLTLAHLAHELNNQLDVAIRLLRATTAELRPAECPAEPLAPKAAQHIGLVQERLEDMAMLLDQVMRRGSEGLDSSRSVAEVMARLTDGLRAMAEMSRVGLDLQIDGGASNLRAGPLESIVVNGVRNAVESCLAPESGPGRVKVSISEAPNGDLVIQVLDNGLGLSGGDAGRLSKPQGHGLGLEVVKHLTEAAGGRWTLDDSDEGAILRVELPAQRDKLQ